MTQNYEVCTVFILKMKEHSRSRIVKGDPQVFTVGIIRCSHKIKPSLDFSLTLSIRYLVVSQSLLTTYFVRLLSSLFEFREFQGSLEGILFLNGHITLDPGTPNSERRLERSPKVDKLDKKFGSCCLEYYQLKKM